MGRKGSDVLLPTTHVGAYPRPIFMQGLSLGDHVDAREFPTVRHRELYEAAVTLVVKDQTDVGIDIVTDGAQHYENETNWELSELFYTFSHHLAGVLPFGDDVVLGSNTLRVHMPTIVGDVEWRRPIFKPVVEAVKRTTDHPLKINVGLGPVTTALLSTDKHYNDVKALAFAFADAYNAEFKDLAARGCEMVQYAEPFTQISNLMDLEPWMIEVNNRAYDGVDMYKVLHLCYGHEQGQPSFDPSFVSAAKVFPYAWDVQCDQFHLELASHKFVEVDALAGWPKDFELGVGVIDVKDMRVEKPEYVADALRKITQVVPADQVHVSTDCAISTLRQIVAKNKLKSLVDGTRMVRDEIEGK